MVSTVAVGESSEHPYVILDEDDRVVEVGSRAPAIFESLRGRRVHEGFPETEALYGPHFERARRTGGVVELAQFSNGHLTFLRAVPGERRRVTVSWELIGFVDVMTLEALQASLAAALRVLTEKEEAVRRERVRSSFSVIAGTG